LPTAPPYLRAVEALARTDSASTGDASARVDPSPALVGRAIAGDVRAWSRLYEELYFGVFRQIRYLAGDAAIAEELAQETFAQAMASRGRYDEARPFSAWLHGIAINVVRKHWRKHRNKQRAHERLVTLTVASGRTGADPGEGHLRRERSRALYAVLDELPPRWREAFVLREIQGLSSAEAASRLSISVDNLAVRLSRARERIREELARRGWIDRGGVA
jgi:RNA polymerase sigma-70 factor (ECF subfamily)